MASRSREYKPKTNRPLFYSFQKFMSRHPDVKARLTKWKQFNEDDKWSEQAVKILVNRLLVKKGALEELERALSSPETPTGCVTIKRTVDGRMQIKLRKALPHVISCRVWRWPDLQSHHELQSLPICKFAFSKKLQQVCINPYHYERVDAIILPPVMVPRFSDAIPSRALLPFKEPTYQQEVWASIAYYEVNNRVGEIFYCQNPSIIVDGFTHPDTVGERFSVGWFTNVQRNSSIQETRLQIGKGIRLQYVNGQVYLECLSGASVFVQSRLFNYATERCASTVCKVLPEGNMKIFDNLVFSNLLCEYVHRNYESVAELTKFCTVRISFGKGWGPPYNIVDITGTPAWIEIHLHEALIWLDQVLVAMEGPNEKISSVS